MKIITRIVISSIGGMIGMLPAVTRSEDFSFVFIGFCLAFGLTLIAVDSIIGQHKGRR